MRERDGREEERIGKKVARAREREGERNMGGGEREILTSLFFFSLFPFSLIL